MTGATATTPPIDHIFRWDLDKTYLATDFDSMGDLLRTFFQKAEEKATVPGADVLLRELLNPRAGQRRAVTFISGSPSQMREVLAKKLRLDGIEPEHFVLKPNLRNLVRGRFRALRGQVGYKLEALLDVRLRTEGAIETLFGDDAESDALIYCLYDDICTGRVGRAYVDRVLAAEHVYPDVRSRILQLIRDNSLGEPVNRVFIHLEGSTPTAAFNAFGARCVPIHNYFQAALVLFADRVLDAGSVLRTALAMHQQHHYTPTMLANSFQDLLRRRRLNAEVAYELAETLGELELPPDLPIGLEPDKIVAEFRRRLRGVKDPRAALLTDVGIPDYLGLVEPYGRKRRKRRKVPRN